MKYLLLLTSILVFLTVPSIAQQTRKTDDALLLQYYQNQQFKEALAYLKTVYTEPVTDVKELGNLAYVSSMAGKLPDAEGYYQRVYDADTTNMTALYNIAGINLHRGNLAKASAYYQSYIQKDSSNFQVYKQLAHISGQRSEILNQLKYFRKANQLDSTESDVASDLGDLYIKFDSLRAAEKVLKIALVADPENELLLQTMLRLYSTQQKWTDAVKTGEQLMQLGDLGITTVSRLGIAYYQLKSYECCIEALLQLSPENRSEAANYYIGASYKQLKDQKNAIAFFSDAVNISISQSTAAYYSEIADSYEILHQLKKASANYQKSLLYKEMPLTYYYLAVLYDTKLKDKRSALKYYKKYVASKPGKAQQAYVAYTNQRIASLRGKKPTQ